MNNKSFFIIVTSLILGIDSSIHMIWLFCLALAFPNKTLQIRLNFYFEFYFEFVFLIIGLILSIISIIILNQHKNKKK